jgi:hypothetical protein
MTRTFFQAYSTQKDGNLSFLYGEKIQVIQNREKFLKNYNININDCVALRTQHKTEIQVVDSSFKEKGMREIESAVHVDALITRDKDLILFLLTADCLPLTFYDVANKVIGLAHLSRENTGLRFVQKIVKTFTNQFQSNPKNIHVSIGPGIHQESYVKNSKIFDSLSSESYKDWKPFLTRLPNGKISIDLIGYNVAQLRNEGITRQNITVSSIDTFQSNDYFSHRRSEIMGEQDGRFATIVSMDARNG